MGGYMRLRNKMTGEIIEACDFTVDEPSVKVMGIDSVNRKGVYSSLAELNEEWDDYKPAEPLIKDEKIRKAVRAWAEACRLKYATYKQSSNEFYDPDTRGKFAIKFTLKPIEVWLDDGKCYTIAELCGEEENEQ